MKLSRERRECISERFNVIYFVYGNNRIMECDRICIYRIYRNFGIVIEQRAHDDQFSIEQFPRTRAYTHSHIHYSFTDTYVVTNIYTLIWKNKNFDISNIFHNLRGNTVFFSFFFIFGFFHESYLSLYIIRLI